MGNPDLVKHLDKQLDELRRHLEFWEEQVARIDPETDAGKIAKNLVQHVQVEIGNCAGAQAWFKQNA